MKNIFASAAVLSSFGQVLCVFCCVIPTATGLLAIFTTLGLASANSDILGDLSVWLHPHKTTFMGVSIALISISWALWFFAHRKEKMTCGCSSKAKKRPVFLIVATLLLMTNLTVIPLLH